MVRISFTRLRSSSYVQTGASKARARATYSQSSASPARTARSRERRSRGRSISRGSSCTRPRRTCRVARACSVEIPARRATLGICLSASSSKSGGATNRTSLAWRRTCRARPSLNRQATRTLASSTTVLNGDAALQPVGCSFPGPRHPARSAETLREAGRARAGDRPRSERPSERPRTSGSRDAAASRHGVPSGPRASRWSWPSIGDKVDKYVALRRSGPLGGLHQGVGPAR